jgi:hypothetical protein
MIKLQLFFALPLLFQLNLFSQTSAPSGLLYHLMSHPELSAITSKTPCFGWIVNSDQPGDMQKGYQIMVASSEELLKKDAPDIWNSGKVSTPQSINIKYQGNPLSSQTSYWWKVKTFNMKSGKSAWSAIQQFNTSYFNGEKKWPGESKWVQINNPIGEKIWALENRHPIIYNPVKPVQKSIRKSGIQFFDFGRAAFSTVEMNLTWKPKESSQKELKLKINIGEKGIGDSIDQKPGGGVIFRTYSMTIKPGTANYTLEIPRFVPRYPHSQAMPPQMPEVIPFRFCEIDSEGENVTVNDITHKALYCLYNENASDFTCSDKDLNAIYNLCKYSTIANTFNGDYANSERERMMYEADCYIQQMGHYAIDREFAIARYSLGNLIYHATWPTEWITHSILMVWADYLNTGNTDIINGYYNDLKAKTMMALETEKGLISSRTGLQSPEFLKSIHFNGSALRDIVDWPNASNMGNRLGGESDNYEFSDYNTVVNAFYYQGLVYMSEFSKAVGKQADAGFFAKKAAAVKIAFNQNFFNSEKGIYVDGIGSSHASLHANMYPLCFGLVPEKSLSTVIGYIKTKRMACGVYGSNYLLEALFNNGQTEYAFSLLKDSTDRSWLNMIRVGATMTTEAWDNKYKSNNGWSHAWSASPAHIIPRKIMGIEPAEPGFGKIFIRPHPGNLTSAKTRFPTIRGNVDVGFTQNQGKSFVLRVTIPTNTSAMVYVPKISPNYQLTQNGKTVKGQETGEYVFINEVKSGTNIFTIVSI